MEAFFLKKIWLPVLWDGINQFYSCSNFQTLILQCYLLEQNVYLYYHHLNIVCQNNIFDYLEVGGGRNYGLNYCCCCWLQLLLQNTGILPHSTSYLSWAGKMIFFSFDTSQPWSSVGFEGSLFCHIKESWLALAPFPENHSQQDFTENFIIHHTLNPYNQFIVNFTIQESRIDHSWS